ncbi:MAG: hypothetical protein ACR2PA_15670, partial [Hyphomicrobiaceae bacterium]
MANDKDESEIGGIGRQGGALTTSTEIDARPVLAAPGEPSGLQLLFKRMFGTWYDTLITIACLALLAWLVPKIAGWGVVEAIWFEEDGDKCGPDAGACWAVIDARWRLILFGLYPFEEHWRSGFACAIVVLVVVLSCVPS